MANRRNPIVVLLSLSAVFFLIFLGLSSYIFMGESPESSGENDASVASTALFGSKKDGVGVLEVKGVILNSKKTLKRLKQFEKNKFIKAIVLRIDSPGGAVAPSQEIYQAIKKFKKPVVASMASVAASGGYYIACGAKTIYANEGSLTGSIGVRMDFMNLKDLYRWAKVSRYTIKGGKFKDAGTDSRAMSPAERKLFQDMIDDVHMQFKKTVADARKLKLSKVNQLADGRIYSGAQAHRVKLVDMLGTMEDAIQEAGKLGKIKGEPKVYFPEKPKQRLFEILMDQADEEDAEASASLKGMVLNWLGLPDLGSVKSNHFYGPRVMWLWDGQP